MSRSQEDLSLGATQDFHPLNPTTAETARALLLAIDGFPPTMPHGVQVSRIRSGDRQPGESAPGFEESDLMLGQLFSGVAVLARDMTIYLKDHYRDDATVFNDVVAEVNKWERESGHSANAFPNYHELPTETLPTGLAALAAEGKPDISPLGDPSIVHEWTTFPGFVFFSSFVASRAVQLRQVVCRDGGIRDQYAAKNLSLAELQVALLPPILMANAAAFWLPLASFVSIILVRRSLDRYCDGKAAAT